MSSPSGSDSCYTRDSHESICGAWRLNTVDLFQGIIGAAYGLIEVDRIVTAARRLHEPTTTAERVHISGVVLDAIRQKMEMLSPIQAECVVGLVNEMNKLPHADIRKVVADLRELIGIDGPTKAEAIRDRVDREYRAKLTTTGLAAAAGLSADEAEYEFKRRFGMTIRDYLMRRRVFEGLALLRGGEKVESVARSVGFKEGKRHFYAAFRAVTGTTPGASRKLAKKCRPRERERERERERKKVRGRSRFLPSPFLIADGSRPQRRTSNPRTSNRT